MCFASRLCEPGVGLLSTRHLSYASGADLKRKPDLAKELGFFRMNPFNPTERMEIDTCLPPGLHSVPRAPLAAHRMAAS